jgi:hypothetical protein
MNDPWRNLLIAAGALWQYSGQGPHAVLSASDNHADFYFNSDKVFENGYGDAVVKGLMALNGSWFDGSSAKRIVSYTGVPSSCEKIVEAAGQITGTTTCLIDVTAPSMPKDLDENINVMIVVDDIYSGKCLKKLLTFLKEKKVAISSPILAIANMSGLTAIDGEEVRSLVRQEIHIWPSENCPMCRSESEAISARKSWNKLVGLVP